jgi:hypothetical protein
MVNNMNFINVQTPPGYIIDPKLKELVDKLALRNPTHTYGGKGWNEDKLQNNSGLRPRGERNLADPRADGLRYLYRVNVHCGTEFLGAIALDIRYGRTSGSEIVYALSSWRIQNERGSQNMTRTSKLDSALRAAKAAFVPQNVDELMHKTEGATLGAFTQAIADLKRPITHGSLVRNFTDLQQYAFYLISGGDIPPEIKQEVENIMTSEKYKTAIAEYELAKRMGGVQMRALRVHNGGYLMRIDESPNVSVVKCLSYEELPEKMQSNLAVLQLMQDGELVYDVGFRLNPDCFLIPRN